MSTTPHHVPPRTLIAEDVPVVRDILARQLSKLGVDAVQACDGAEALQALETEPFDLLLLDLSMPNVDGLEVVRRLRAQHHAWPAPLIAVISVNADDVRTELAELGVTRLVPKPIRPPQLAALLEEARHQPAVA